MNPGLVVAGMIVIGLIAFLASRKTGITQVSPTEKAMPEVVTRAIKAIKDGTATCSQLSEAAKVAEEHGLNKVVEFIRNKFDILCAVKEVEKTLPSRLESRLEGVSDDAWSEYVSYSKQGRLTTISPGYHLGYFLLGMESLQDLGYAINVKRQDYKGRLVKKGEWAGPYSLEGFLSDPMLQYEAFARKTKNDANYILKRHSDKIGMEFEGKQATLSGLVAVAKQAGLSGMEKWMTETSEKRKPNTTKAYLLANGIF